MSTGQTPAHALAPIWDLPDCDLVFPTGGAWEVTEDNCARWLTPGFTEWIEQATTRMSKVKDLHTLRFDLARLRSMAELWKTIRKVPCPGEEWIGERLKRGDSLASIAVQYLKPGRETWGGAHLRD